MKIYRYDSVEYERSVDFCGWVVVFNSKDGFYAVPAYDKDVVESKWNSQEAKDAAVMTAALDRALEKGYRLLLNPEPVRFMCPR